MDVMSLPRRAFPLPVIAIVGRPNVGKSTLFNRLVGKRIAIVEDTPGVTRDRLYAQAEWQGRPYALIDTGGILFGEGDPLIEQVRLQAEIAMQEADLILFLVDAKEGLTTADEEIAALLRRWNKPVFLIVNKADNPQRWELVCSEFYALGLEDPIPLSSLHGHGVAELLERIFDRLPEAEAVEEEGLEAIRIAIVGRPNVGKSSLLNAIVGEPRAIISEQPGTTRDAIDTPFEWQGQPIVLIDTAGLKRPGKVQRSLEYYVQLRSERAIQRADIALVVLDGKEGITHGDKRVAQYADKEGKGLIWVINKWDLVEPPDGQPQKRSQAKRDFERLARHEAPAFTYAPLCYLSAKYGTGISALLETVITVAEHRSFRVDTGELNRILAEAQFERPYTRRGRLLKIYYATMPAVRPPTIVLFVNDPERAHFSYLRYLENCLRKNYPYLGTPLRFVLRAAHKKDAH